MRPESQPNYVSHCVECFLGALSEAQELIERGHSEYELVEEALHYAKDLLDIIETGVSGAPMYVEGEQYIKGLRRQLQLISDAAAAIK